MVVLGIIVDLLHLEDDPDVAFPTAQGRAQAAEFD